MEGRGTCILRREWASGQAIPLPRIDRSTGRHAWYIGEPLPSSGWVLGSVTDAGPLWRSEATTARRLIQTEIATLLFLLTLLGARLAETYAARRRAILWAGSAVASLAVAAAIAHAWHLAYTLPPAPDAHLTPIFAAPTMTGFFASASSTRARARSWRS